MFGTSRTRPTTDSKLSLSQAGDQEPDGPVSLYGGLDQMEDTPE